MSLSISFIGYVGILSVSKADIFGVEYVVNSDVLVYGGSSYYSRSQAPDDIHTLYIRQRDADGSKALFRSEGALTNIEASQQGEFVAVLDQSSKGNVSEEQSNYVSREYDKDGNLVEIYYDIQSTLRILNLQGDVLDSIPDVRRYTWDLSGDRIAYITGTEYEGGFGFSPTGTWFYDVASRQAERIHSGGYDVQWAAWNGNIYIYDPFKEQFPDTRVFQFDTSSGELATTSHQGIYFSPDGRRYVAQGYEGSSLRVFETESEGEIAVDLTIYSLDRSREAYFAAGWLDESTLIVPTPIPGDQGDYLYDIDSRTMWQADGPIVPVRRADDEVLVLQGTTVVERARSELRLVR
jgi:hypothetical protein